MKGFSKALGNIKRKTTGLDGTATPPPLQGDTPEAIASRCMTSFIQSGNQSGGDEVTFLPPIVESAESSPAAAEECARLLRKYLHKDYWTKPSYQYNALMLMRILVDNPGQSFTRNVDKKFVDVVKELLRSGKDLSVRNMLMETLDAFEQDKQYDEGLKLLLEMWKKEKEKAYKVYGGRPPPINPYPQLPPGAHMGQQPYHQPHHHSSRTRPRRLPDPVELANRLEEARTSAKLLTQVVQNTPPDEVLRNDLIREFSDRCSSASRSIQGYMAAENPGPDNDTMEALIDTNEQLQQALNLHQRASLHARKHLGLGAAPADGSPMMAGATVERQDRPAASNGDYAPPDGPPPNGAGRSKGKGKDRSANPAGSSSAVAEPSFASYPAAMASMSAGPSRSMNGTPRNDEAEDPFRDPPNLGDSRSSSRARQPAGGSGSRAPPLPAKDEEPQLGFESYHPGFGGSGAAGGSSGKAPAATAGDVSPIANSPVQARAEPGAGAGPQRRSSDDEREGFGEKAASKQPMYRY